jgi:hypothetical protein
VGLECGVQRDAVHSHQVWVAHAAANGCFLEAQTNISCKVRLLIGLLYFIYFHKL